MDIGDKNMNLKANEPELKKEYAYLTATDLLRSMKDDIEYLATHNKNYTQKQYYKILTLQSFINNIQEA